MENLKAKMKKHWNAFWNIIPLPLSFGSVSTLLTLTFNLGVNLAIIGAIFYILGEKIKGREWAFFSAVAIGTIAAQYLNFGGWVGVILIFIAYAFVAKAILKLDTTKAIVIGVVMALLTAVGMQPYIGQPVYGVMESAGRAMTGI